MRITIRGVRPEVLESTREAGKAVATRVRYDVLLNVTPRSQWRACFTSPSSYCADDLPSQYTFGEKCISYECPQNEAKCRFDQLRDYIRQANARSQELDDLLRNPPPRVHVARREAKTARRTGVRAAEQAGQEEEQGREVLDGAIVAEAEAWLTEGEEDS